MLNKVILIGRVGKEPEIRQFESGSMATFSLATSKKYTKDGEKKEQTEWHNVVVNGKLSEVVEKWVHKGDLLYIEGEIKYQDFEKDGVKKTFTKIFCSAMQMLSSKSEPTQQMPPEHVERNYNFPAQPPQGYDDEPNDLPF